MKCTLKMEIDIDFTKKGYETLLAELGNDKKVSSFINMYIKKLIIDETTADVEDGIIKNIDIKIMDKILFDEDSGGGSNLPTSN